jgi:hypothetical protein
MLTGELMKELTKYDSQGRPIELTWVDDEGNPTVNQYGVACMQSTYLEASGVSRYESCYDSAGNLIEDKLGIHTIRRIWDTASRVETETFHDINGELIDILYGFCEVHYYLDSNDQLRSAYCFDREGEIVEELVYAGCEYRGETK